MSSELVLWGALMLSLIAQTEDAGLAAFFQKRKPDFKGWQ